MIASTVNIVSTQKDLAIALDCDERTIRRYVARGMPCGDNCYDVEECREWVSKNIIQRITVDTRGTLAEQRMKAEIAKLWEQAKREALKNEIAEGGLWDAEDVKQWVAGILSRVRERLLAMPDEFEMRLPQEVRAEVKSDLENYINLVLKETAERVASGPSVT